MSYREEQFLSGHLAFDQYQHNQYLIILKQHLDVQHELPNIKVAYLTQKKLDSGYNKKESIRLPDKTDFVGEKGQKSCTPGHR